MRDLALPRPYNAHEIGEQDELRRRVEAAAREAEARVARLHQEIEEQEQARREEEAALAEERALEAETREIGEADNPALGRDGFQPNIAHPNAAEPHPWQFFE